MVLMKDEIKTMTCKDYVEQNVSKLVHLTFFIGR